MTDDLQPQCVLPSACELGEGALWTDDERAVWFVDILGLRLHRYETETGRHDSWATPTRPGFVVRGTDGVIVGLEKGLYRFSLVEPVFRLLVSVESDRPQNRLNDGVVGPDGALWFGSKNEPEDDATGAWYRWTGTGDPVRFDDGYVVTNGPAFSLDGRTLYHSDSVRRRVLARTVEPDGSVGDNRVFAEIEETAGYPDGLAVDSEDCVWVAMYAGRAVRRYNSDGQLLGTYSLPCAHVTRPAFGGPDRRTIYLTTARHGLSDDERAIQPQAGALFAMRSPVPGPISRSFEIRS
jgi:sugar lactone lactonase YvrE